MQKKSGKVAFITGKLDYKGNNKIWNLNYLSFGLQNGKSCYYFLAFFILFTHSSRPVCLMGTAGYIDIQCFLNSNTDEVNTDKASLFV